MMNRELRITPSADDEYSAPSSMSFLTAGRSGVRFHILSLYWQFRSRRANDAPIEPKPSKAIGLKLVDKLIQSCQTQIKDPMKPV